MRLKNHDISMYDESFLAQSIEKRMTETGCGSPEEFNSLLLSDSGEEDAFYGSLHINYSEFFRNPLTFAVLEEIVLPELIRKAHDQGRRELRIWSAGCASGQEPYSVAILLEELMESVVERFEYRIFATDVCTTRIAAGCAAEYSFQELCNVSLKRITKWFSRQGDSYKVNPRLTGRIVFSMFDVLDSRLSCPPESIFGNFDLILCCNLLFYYTAQYRKSILEKLTNSLGSEAYLVTGETERGFIMEHGYREIFPWAAVFRRGNL